MRGAGPAGVVVMGADAALVRVEVARRRQEGGRVVGFVGDDEQAARAMGEELLGGEPELVRV